MNRTFIALCAGIAAASLAAGYGAGTWMGGSTGSAGSGAMQGEDEILYWVAPMDPNFRRDAPGKSPMGMDLIPVYADDDKDKSGEPALQISAAAVNNIGVRTAPVRRETLPFQVDTVGFIAPDEERLSSINVRTEGWIEELMVETAGEQVEKGQVLFRLYAPEILTAQREYLQAKRLGQSEMIAAGKERLVALGMSGDQIEELSQRRKVIRLVDVRAPRAGILLSLDVRQGSFVRPSDVTMRLADLSSVWVMADLFEATVGRVAAGQKAEVTLPSFPGKTWEGQVDYVYPMADPRTRTIPVRLRLENPDRLLKPAMFANVEIEGKPAMDTLTVPVSALIRHSSQDRVIVALGEGRFRPTPVKAGLESGGRVQVLEGVSEGEEIVTAAQFLIDSEASLDPALLRMTSATPEDELKNKMGKDMEENMDEAMDMSMDMQASQPGTDTDAYETTASVLSVNPETRQVTLDHEPVAELGWPSMQMGFAVSEKVGLRGIEPGTKVHVRFRKSDMGYEIIALHPLSGMADEEDAE